MIKTSRVFSCLLLSLAAACGDNMGGGSAAEPTVDPAVQTVVNEDGTVAFSIPVQGDPSAMSFLVSTRPAHGSVSGTGPQFLYTPGSDFAGKDSFRITVTDLASKQQTIVPVFIGIDAVNDPPVAHDDQFATAEDTDLVIPTSAVLANDVDVDSKLTVVAVTQPEQPTLCSLSFGCSRAAVTLDGDTITYHPYHNFNGSQTFTYTVSDGQYLSTADVTVRVSAVNDAPYAADYQETIPDDTDYTVSVAELVNLHGYDPDGDTMFVSGVSNATGGTVSMDPLDGVVTFTPDKVKGPLFQSSTGAGFDFTISDGHLTSTAHATFFVQHVNHAPITADDTLTLDQDTTVPFDPYSFLDNDSDPDDDAMTAWPSTAPLHGSLSGMDGHHMFYTPDEGYVGPDSFDYGANDGLLVTHGTVHITVKHVNHAPSAKDDTLSTAQDKVLSFNMADLLSNDSDPDTNDTFTGAVTTQPTNGSLTWDAQTGAMTYTPSLSGAPTDDSFTYTITDAGALTSTATVNISVGQPNHAPTASDDSISVEQDGSKSFDVSAKDSDGDQLTYSVVDAPTHGTLSLTGSSASYTPASGYTGPDSFTFTASDGQLTSSAATVTIDVQAASCSHSGCETGCALSSSQDACVADVCTHDVACCEGSWDEECVSMYAQCSMECGIPGG